MRVISFGFGIFLDFYLVWLREKPLRTSSDRHPSLHFMP